MSTIPLVALNVKAPEQYDVLDQYSKLAQLKALQNQQQNAPLQRQILENTAQQGQMENRKTQQTMQEREAAQKALSDAGGDIGAALPTIMKVAPTYGLTLQKQVLESKDADLKAKTSIIGYHQKQAERTAQIAGSVTDPTSYANAIQQAVGEGLIDEQTGQSYLQKGYDPAFVKGLQSQALTVQQQLQQAHDQLVLDETKRHNQASETKPSEAMQGMNDFLSAKAAAKGSPLTAQEGLEARQEYYKRNKSQASVSVAGSTGTNDIKDTAQMIKDGQAPPVLTEYSFRDRTKIAGELHRMGYNLAGAEQDWKATQKYLQTANGAQQTRIRQSISALPELADKIEGLYNEWTKIAPTSGFRTLNKASLAAMKHLPGRPGAVAQALDAQIADAVSDLAVVYMGGNSPTDHGLGLAQKNLSSDWNDSTFREGLKQMKLNAQIRKNSLNVGPTGVSGNSPYPGNMGGGQGGAQPRGNDPFAQFGGRAH
jgi:hypothetical protein